MNLKHLICLAVFVVVWKSPQYEQRVILSLPQKISSRWNESWNTTINIGDGTSPDDYGLQEAPNKVEVWHIQDFFTKPEAQKFIDDCPDKSIEFKIVEFQK